MVLQKAPQKAVLWGYGRERQQVAVYLTSSTVLQKVLSAPVTNGKSGTFVSCFVCVSRKSLFLISVEYRLQTEVIPQLRQLSPDVREGLSPFP